MALTPISASLFAPPTASVISNTGSWLDRLLTGSLSVALCVLAIGFLGLLMIGGRLALREALRVTIGCFVLLGAPVISHGLLSSTSDVQDAGAAIAAPSDYVPPTTSPLPPAQYDPYAGASLRID